jgi:dipeptidase
MCDTLVALGNSTEHGKTILAKNSDRDPDEPAEILYIPRKRHPKGSEVQATYIKIPQVHETAEVILCKPIWIWGAEMGTNEYGVSIGNEAVFTKEKYQKKYGLLGMDLLRFGLERGKTAKESLEIIIDLLELYGQGGNHGYRNASYYHNSYIIADQNEAYVLETAGKYWIVEKVKNIRAISNTITIRGAGDFHHPELIEHAIAKGWCHNAKKFDFYNHYQRKTELRQIFAKGKSRINCATKIMQENKGKITAQIMMKILRKPPPEKEDWNPARDASLNSICVHAKGVTNPSQSTIAMVSVLDEKLQTNWITGTSATCLSTFKPVFLPGGMPKTITPTTEFYHKENLWWRHEYLHRLVLQDYVHRFSLFKGEKELIEQIIINETRKFIDMHLAKYKNLDEKESVLILQEYAKLVFEKVQAAEENWIEKVKKEPVKRKPKIAYLNYWRKRNKWNKMPEIK